ncbi:hypothetical protein HZ326_30355 [Fusarium oxysporum f. sp. albedinis]|nr:hypothetical protein HZ326_30355 [Fusarium oxysporum f. sp. albedinis]
MVLTYVDPFERPQTSEDGTHSHLVERTDIAPPPTALCADNGVANEDESAIVPPLAEDETNRLETLAETFCEIFDFQNMADWELDCVALYVSQLARVLARLPIVICSCFLRLLFSLHSVILSTFGSLLVSVFVYSNT